MDTAEEASDYDAMDHREVNARFCADLAAFVAARGVRLGRVLDVGTGTALIPIELCTRAPAVTVDALDLAEHMLALARRNVERAGLASRIALHKADAKRSGFAERSFSAVVSNSIVHHIPEPAGVLAEMWRLVAPGGVLFVRDLARPDSAARVDELCDQYAPRVTEGDAETRAMHDRQRALFAASLHAALTADEVRAMLAPLGIAGDAVTLTSDRHWTLSCARP